MRAIAHVPFNVAIKSIEITKSNVLPLVAPSETVVLEMDLKKLTSLKGNPEAVDMATVDICIVIVPSMTDLVEVT
jgi:hypothetical protein